MTPRFYLPGVRDPGAAVSLRGEEFHHLRNVLRLGPGDEIALFDGEGRGFSGRILEVGRSEARIRVGAEEPRSRESPLHLVLIAALPKGEKLELVIQKATELGVNIIRPVSSSRSEIRRVPGRDERKLERWRKIAVGACKQSGRSRVPRVDLPVDLPSALTHPGADLKVVLDAGAEGEPPSFGKVGPVTSAILAVGPEGGWSGEERLAFQKAGFLPLRLGPRVLRSETAAIVSTALLQFLAGDLDSRKPAGPQF